MLSREDVLKIARLARLELSEEEISLYQNRLGRVLDYIHELSQVPTPKDAFVRHVPQDAVAFREDKVAAFADQEALMKNAPAMEGNCFLLPTVVDHE
jgi:aspartyl-tRNA(Asn)/glutamyl-tRNA(Gln) amidotransferase subunit C